MEESLHESDEDFLHCSYTTEAETTQRKLNECLKGSHLRLSNQVLKFDEWQIVYWMQEHANSIQKASFEFITRTETLEYIAGHGLAQLKNLVYLELSFLGCGLSANGMEAILDALANLPHLRRLQVHRCDVGESKEEVVGLLVRDLPGLHSLGIAKNQLIKALGLFLLVPTTILSLDVSQSRITEEFGSLVGGYAVHLNPFLDFLGLRDCDVNNILCKSIVEGLGNMATSLTQLDLGQNSIGDEGATALASILAASHNALESLNLGWNDIGAEGAMALANGFIGNLTSLVSLDLSCNGIGDEGAVALGNAFTRNHKSSLKFLHLSRNKIGSQGLIVLMKNLKSLKFLSLDGNVFGDDGTPALGTDASVWNHNLLIEFLDVSSNGIEDRGAMEFARILDGSHKGFKELRLVDNGIGNEGAMAIAKALPKNRFLESLDLSQNDICDEGAMALAGALTVNQCLECLGLHVNRIGVRGAMALGDALTKNKFLKYLIFAGNQMEDEGALAIANGLHSNKSLTHLDLAANSIGDVGAVGFADMLRSNSVLRLLCLYGNRDMTEKGRKVLGCAVQQNRVVEYLQLPDSLPDCPWYQCVTFFTACNRTRLWSVIQNENAVIPWHRAFHVLLNGSRTHFLGESFLQRISAVFLLLWSRPDIVVGTHRMTRPRKRPIHPSDYNVAKRRK